MDSNSKTGELGKSLANDRRDCGGLVLDTSLQLVKELVLMDEEVRRHTKLKKSKSDGTEGIHPVIAER